MDEARRWGKATLRAFLATLLATMMLPGASPRTAWADEGAASPEADAILQQLSAGEYVDGEVLAIIDNTVAQNGLLSRGSDLLASAEQLMDVSGETYATATGEEVPLEEPAANGAPFSRSAASLPEDDAMSIALVREAGASTEDLMRRLQDDPRVLAVEPNYVYRVGDPEQAAFDERAAAVAAAIGLDASGSTHAMATADTASPVPDLTSFQWGCDNAGNTLVDGDEPAIVDFDVNPPSWNDPTASNAAGAVAVVDTGVDYNHPDLNGVMCDMTQYTAKGGRYGFNAVDGMDPADPRDDYGHGTHCAGIIAAQWDDVGTSGVASGVELVAVRSADSKGRLAMASTIKGYEYLAEAIDGGMPLKAINNSWGGVEMSRSFDLAVTKLGEKGAVSIVSSGNASTDLDKNPGTAVTLMRNPYAVVVNASTLSGKLARFSNYGVETTDVAAPGVNVLSTVPLGMAAYAPESDGAPLAFETFESGSAPTVTVSAAAESAESIGTVMQGSTRYDDRGGSLKSDFSAMPAGQMGSMETRSAVVSIPVEEQLQASARYVGMHLITSNHQGDSAVVQIAMVKDGNQTWTNPTTSTIVGCSLGWTTIALDAQALAQEQGGTLAFSDGKLSVKLTIVRSPGSAFESGDALYLDTVGVGAAGSAAPYQYMSGTSMATPMTTGAAMVLAQDVGDATPADGAAKLAALVKATVSPSDEFAGTCSSGGQVDLAQIAPSGLAPVVSQARTEADGDATLVVVEGSYFGAAQGSGAVRIAGKEAVVRSWADNAITAECPQGLKSGVHIVEVVAGNGKSGAKGFLLEVPERPGSQFTPLFGKTIALPTPEEGLSAGTTMGFLIGLGGSLYLLPNDAETHMPCYALWRYDPDRDDWARCADMPEQLGNISQATFDGKLYVYGEAGQDAEAAPRLVSYDAATNSWTEHDASRLPLHATIVNCDGSMLVVGGAVYNGAAWAELAEGNLAAYDVQTGDVTVVGSLASGLSVPSVVARGTELFVSLGDEHAANGQAKTNDKLERIVKSGDSYASTDLSAAVPTLASGYALNYALAAVKNGLILSGYGGVAEEEKAATGGAASLLDEDTYLLDLANGSQRFQGIGQRASRAALYYPTATAYEGWLYVMGFSSYEDGGWVLRATAIETLPQPGDLPSPEPVLTPNPAPAPTGGKGEASALARTGDALGAAELAWAVAALALAGVALAAWRKSQQRR